MEIDGRVSSSGQTWGRLVRETVGGLRLVALGNSLPIGVLGVSPAKHEQARSSSRLPYGRNAPQSTP